ncbi:MAG: hypothetical protein OXI63_25220 [Candidatus Poribacteria bacterium]|nr:hypothetical protein [Candidatus Poribacteria bacterium]
MADAWEKLRIGGEAKGVSTGMADARHLARTEVSGRTVQIKNEADLCFI